MPEEIEQIRLPDGQIRTVTYLTDESEWPLEIRRLVNSAREAGRHAVQELLDSGIPAVFLEDGKIVKLFPDGHKEVIQEKVKGVSE